MKTTHLLSIIFVFVAAGWIYGQSGGVQAQNSDQLKDVIAGEVFGEDYLLIDVRTPEEFQGGLIPSAINIDYRVIADQMSKVDRDTPIIVYCRTGRRSHAAFTTLLEMGFTNVSDFGGIIHWDGDIFIPR